MSRSVIESLIAEGFKIDVSHNRVVVDEGSLIPRKGPAYPERGLKLIDRSTWRLYGRREKLHQNGGVTYCRIYRGDRNFVGIAICSMADAYNNKVGFNIAFGRALKMLREHAS